MTNPSTFKSLGVHQLAGTNNDIGYSPGGGSGMDLGPKLNKWVCRDCQKPIPENRATCPHCTTQGGGS